MFLTDGMPNIIPPGGHIHALRKYKDSHTNFQFTINTFGFGYGLDSKLLDDIANEGSGMYYFIPDSSFVGTSFVHATSNILCTAARNAVLMISPSNSVEILTVMGGVSYDTTSWGVRVDIGNLQLGQSKDVTFRVKVSNPGVLYERNAISASWEFTRYMPLRKEAISVDFVTAARMCSGVSDHEENHCMTVNYVNERLCRCKFVDDVRESLVSGINGDLGRSGEIVRELEHMLKKIFPMAARMVDDSELNMSATLISSSDNHIVALIHDVTGQIKESVSRAEWFKRWGQHYILSLTRAHQLQICSNFKDPGVQVYGGTLFEHTKQIGDEAFLKLPPPKASLMASSSYSATSYTNLRSMSYYHDKRGACFDGNCFVTMADGSTKVVKDIQAGDLVAVVVNKSDPFTEHKNITVATKVVCVVKTECANGMSELCIFNNSGLRVTPYHPIRMNGKWYFPKDHVEPQKVYCKAVYSFLLDRNISGIVTAVDTTEDIHAVIKTASRERAMLINGVEVATLGHDITDDPVVSHSYFGSSRIVDDLRVMRGWNEGLVCLQPGSIVRDKQKGIVIGLCQQP